jgi:5-aminopentanamidase
MPPWTVAGVQMDCRRGDLPGNLAAVRARLREAAGRGARLVAFPECVLSGYCFDSLDEAWPHAEPVPGPATEALVADCRSLGTWAVVGMLERDEPARRLFNTAVLVGPAGQLFSYRKIHLPLLGVDRFVTPGDRPFAVHDLGGLRVGLNICFDGSFPESSRVLAVLGADLVVLPTNWPLGARPVVCHLVQARALENHLYYLAVNRVGEERGFRFLGQSRLVEPSGELLAASDGDAAEFIVGQIEPEKARQKRRVIIPGVYEVDRVGGRRPEMYGPLCQHNKEMSDES